MDNFDYGAENRLECLKLAQATETTDYAGRPQGAVVSCVLERAEKYAGFVNGPAAKDGEGTADEALSAAATAPGHLRDAAGDPVVPDY